MPLGIHQTKGESVEHRQGSRAPNPDPVPLVESFSEEKTDQQITNISHLRIRPLSSEASKVCLTGLGGCDFPQSLCLHLLSSSLQFLFCLT